MSGWLPTVDFENGVAEMLEHIEAYREAILWDAEAIGQATRVWFENLGRGI